MTDDPTGLSPEARALIAQARGGDDPTDADRARVRRALWATAAGGAGLAATSAASSAAASTVGTGLAATVVKVAAVVLVVGGVGAGAVMIAPWDEPPPTRVEAPAPTARSSEPTRERAPRAAPQPSPAAPVVEAPPAVDAPPVVPAPVPVAEPSPAPEVPPRAETPRPRPSRPALVEPAPAPLSEAAPVPASTLAAEVALLRSAQAALNGGDPETALARLADHARRFPDGAMAEEREAARVLALCRAGRDGEARGAADRFLRERPQSPLAPRVGRGCER